jgi:hypothetical protein
MQNEFHELIRYRIQQAYKQLKKWNFRLKTIILC